MFPDIMEFRTVRAHYDGIDYHVVLGPDEQVIQTKYPQQCSRCRVIVARREAAIWKPNVRELRHLECPGVILPSQQKEPDMHDLDRQIRATQLTLATMLEQREVVSSWGEDSDYPVDTVLSWTRTMNGKTYTYLALKAYPNGWYLTGTQGRLQMGFGDLVATYLAKADEVWIATGWEQVSR